MTMAGKGKGRTSGGTAVLEAPARESIGDAALAGDFAVDVAAPTPEGMTVAPSQAEGDATFVMLALEAIAESPYNPRKHFDPKELAELTASVKLDGVWEPVLVRPHASGHGVYELASGHRRYRASKAAGRTHIPALIRPLSDETFIKLLTIANLQREDVHPLEQADAFAVQMKEFGWKPDRIARECGRGETFVYDHLKFLTLIPAVRDLFFANRISTAHAVELTRLTPVQQAQAIDPERGGLWQPENLTDRENELAMDLEDAGDQFAGRKTKTFRELRAWIQDYLRFDVAAADPVLFPSATMVQAAVEEQLKIFSITWDRYPRDEAKKASDEKILTPLHWRRADGQKGSATCEHAAKAIGVVVVGPDQGDSFAICRAREKCEVHFGDEIREKAKAVKAAAKAGKAGKGSAKTPSAPREQAWEREQRLRDAKRDAFRPAFLAVREALVAKLKALPFKMGGPLVQLAEKELRVSGEARKALGKLKSAEDLIRAVAISQVLDVRDHWAYDELPKVGKSIGVDVAKLVASATKAAADKTAPSKGTPATQVKGGKR